MPVLRMVSPFRCLSNRKLCFFVALDDIINHSVIFADVRIFR